MMSVQNLNEKSSRVITRIKLNNWTRRHFVSDYKYYSIVNETIKIIFRIFNTAKYTQENNQIIETWSEKKLNLWESQKYPFHCLMQNLLSM